MAKNMALSILAHKVPEIGTQAHVCSGTFLKVPFHDRKATEQTEAFPVQQILPQLFKPG